MATRPPRIQYGLKTVILITIVCAFGVTWWRQSKQRAQLNATQQKLRWLQADAEIDRAANDVYLALDLENEKHRQAFKVMKSIRMPFGTVQRKRIEHQEAVLELILFHSNSTSIPGSVISVAVLLNNGELVDVIDRQTSTRIEWREAVIEDVNNDGASDLVFHCTPGPWADSKPMTIAYVITNQGFAPLAAQN